MVNSTIWLLMATMIATIEVSKPLDSDSDKNVNFIDSLSEPEPQLVYDNLFFR